MKTAAATAKAKMGAIEAGMMEIGSRELIGQDLGGQDLIGQDMIGQAVSRGEPTVRPAYLEALTLVERLHRRLLDVIKDEFDRRGRSDVNSVQALLLYNIGDKELTAGELRTKGYYLGSNVSYNVKKLVELGFLHHARSRLDRRSVRISLTPKGKEVHAIVAALYDKHVSTVEQIGGISSGEFTALNQSLARLERFWTDQIRFRL